MDGKVTYSTVYSCCLWFSSLFNRILMWTLGTLLNSKSQISEANAKALKEAMLRGLKVVIATGKVRRQYFFNDFMIGLFFGLFNYVWPYFLLYVLLWKCSGDGIVPNFINLSQSRPGAIRILKTADLTGSDGIISESSPGVFVQVRCFF